MKLFQIFVLFALFAAPAFAYDVGIKVTVAQDTLAVGTNITIVKDGVTLYNTRAGADGAAIFNLDAGSYFVYLDRGGYPRHVNLLEVNGTRNTTYTMRQDVSSASAYGQITGPTNFDGASVAAYASGNIVKRATPNKDGYYTLLYLPQGDYDLVFSVQGFVEKTEPVSLVMSQFTEVDAKLEKISVAPPEVPVMTAPAAAKQQSVIEILIMKGSSPLAGQAVEVKTPAGNIEVITGADGKARVNAVMSGEYLFTYGNFTMKTVVASEENATPVQPPAEVPEQPAQSQQAPPAQNNGLAVGAIMLAMVAVIAVIGAAIFMMGKMVKKGKQDERAEHQHGKHEHPHAHGHKKK